MVLGSIRERWDGRTDSFFRVQTGLGNGASPKWLFCVIRDKIEPLLLRRAPLPVTAPLMAKKTCELTERLPGASTVLSIRTCIHFFIPQDNPKREELLLPFWFHQRRHRSLEKLSNLPQVIQWIMPGRELNTRCSVSASVLHHPASLPFPFLESLEERPRTSHRQPEENNKHGVCGRWGQVACSSGPAGMRFSLPTP